MAGETVLIVDDDAATRELISRLLSNEGYQVETADSHEMAIRVFDNSGIDLVLLDVLMPGIDGWETCARLRSESNVLIMLVSALDHEQDIVRGLRAGADDFYVKPVHKDMLLARVEALLRRSHSNQHQHTHATGSRSYSDGYLRIDLESRRVYVDEEPVSLTPTELKLLGFLLRNTGRAVSYRQILDNVWGWTDEGRIGYVHTYISRLRQKLERNPSESIYITNEYGFGYRFEEQE